MADYRSMFKVGDKLVIELKSKDIYEGIYAGGGRDRVCLAEVSQHNNKNRLGDLYDFYRSEISRIHSLKLPNSRQPPGANKIDNNVTNVTSTCKMIKMCQEEYCRLKEMSQSYVYLENVDKRYYDAVQLLKESETVGLVALGMENQRMGSLIRLLVMCTWKQVFIFDLTNLEKRKFYPELKEILESEYVCKVIHKSAAVVDVLFGHYDVFVQNVFDTQIVDLMFQKTMQQKSLLIERDLSECLVEYLNFPSYLLEEASIISTKKWAEKPLPEKRKLYAAQLVTYLIVLKEHFQRILLGDVYRTINNVQDYVYNLNDFDFTKYVKEKEVPQGVQDLIPNLKHLGIDEV
ncbi:piRNA biogenesis protein EXD1-like [Cylas formicarius]|uniref:piRNA biogenesis protein EXD1-like n=1 Tax=Cylas formicarius TaxID=197179 RepID=UPI002958817D|nr:piRNA biogenesis protein EXD1-like [Cylas formicarius]